MDANIMSAAASTTTRETGRMRYFLHWLAISTWAQAATEYTPIQDGSATQRLCQRLAVPVLFVFLTEQSKAAIFWTRGDRVSGRREGFGPGARDAIVKAMRLSRRRMPLRLVAAENYAGLGIACPQRQILPCQRRQPNKNFF